MFNTYSQNINVNDVSGTLVKNYEKSFFYRFRGDTAKGDKILEGAKPSAWNGDFYEPVVVIQCMILADNYFLAEVMWEKDFDELFKLKELEGVKE